jgi:AcrR family transcriptional regulator
MTQSRDAYHHGDLRNALVTSAVRLIEAGGPASFSLREAAREVGVSANAAYRHFDDKSALITAVAAEGFAQLAQRMVLAMAAAHTPPCHTSLADADLADAEAHEQFRAVARFKAVGRAYVAFAIDHSELFRVMFSEHGAACRSTPSTAQTAVTPWTLLGATLDGLVEAGLLAHDQRAASSGALGQALRAVGPTQNATGRRAGAELKAWSVVHGFACLALDGLAGPPAPAEQGADGPSQPPWAVALEPLLDFAVAGLCCASPAGAGTE